MDRPWQIQEGEQRDCGDVGAQTNPAIVRSQTRQRLTATGGAIRRSIYRVNPRIPTSMQRSRRGLFSGIANGYASGCAIYLTLYGTAHRHGHFEQQTDHSKPATGLPQPNA